VRVVSTGSDPNNCRLVFAIILSDLSGNGVRTVNKWGARQADITLLPYMQEVLDTALSRASGEVKAWFAAVARARGPEQLPGPPIRGVMVPVVVDGRLSAGHK
jgi:hypothetical protein